MVLVSFMSSASSSCRSCHGLASFSSSSSTPLLERISFLTKGADFHGLILLFLIRAMDTGTVGFSG